MKSTDPLPFFTFVVLIESIFAQVTLPPPPPVTLPIPVTPFGNPRLRCPTRDGLTKSVNLFPSSPFVITPFVDEFKDPPAAVPSNQKECRADGHCMFSYDIVIKEIQKRPFDNAVPGCKAHPATWFLSYNGSIPGPTIRDPVGHEAIVRFENQIDTVGGYFKGSYAPCLAANGRTGRPISVHFHGSASLAPYDGWADDETCFDEIKDYVYPNNRAGPGWYHDHAAHITADNAYLGLAGFKIISAKLKDGGCGEPWNLEDIEDHQLMLADKLLDNTCQLKMDHVLKHKSNFYGDINVVNGIPFPQMNLEPKWMRFRLLNAAVSRPWLIKIKDEQLVDISPKICRIIATDGGFRMTDADYPTEGLYIGVAERYEVVCDFSAYAGRTVYIWNDFNAEVMKEVPYFCNSHLISRITFGQAPATPAPAFIPSQLTPDPTRPIFNVLSADDINAATAMALAGQFHREMLFGRNGGHWTINGQTWDTAKIQAADVGQNTWEVWRFSTGGGWFHPVHMHLVDFFLLRRDTGAATDLIAPYGLRTNEIMSPKDVFYLGPGEDIYVLARFGPHKGDYMFHCHNLIHEDNDMMVAMKVIDSALTTTNQNTAQQFLVVDGLVYNNYKYSDPMLGETAAKPKALATPFTSTYVSDMLSMNLYRIFYPNATDTAKLNAAGGTDPWQAQWCPQSQ